MQNSKASLPGCIAAAYPLPYKKTDCRGVRFFLWAYLYRPYFSFFENTVKYLTFAGIPCEYTLPSALLPVITVRTR